MTFPPDREPPNAVVLSLEEALELIGALEDARDALLITDHLVEVALVSNQLLRINRRLGFPDDDEGGDDAR
jgi:hypothetical protein